MAFREHKMIIPPKDHKIPPPKPWPKPESEELKEIKKLKEEIERLRSEIKELKFLNSLTDGERSIFNEVKDSNKTIISKE